ncbi:MAG TPA: oligopeptidase B, partial [Atlantibacter hermannii]|nr:oligopeptidase B [Enterobacteriaceae bacterium]HCC10699.1 oligopeptidase B [Atlantibacter hermannii]
YHKKHFRRGANPLLVYGYGSYGTSMDADFSSSRLSLLDRGFIYAIAHIRGGGELGQNWYESGKFLQKKNTFYDYIDVCEALLAQGYGDPRYLYGMGGSAGGMLIGAAINMRPDLFHGAIAQVPFVDVVTTMLDESIPLTTGEFEEWGNPQDETYYHYMKSYSPYDQVSRQKYPHLLVTTGLHDSQVQYWEPAKWVAKLREYKTDDSLLLLCTDMDSGHGGKSGRFKSYEGVAMEYAFLIGLTQGTLGSREGN